MHDEIPLQLLSDLASLRGFGDPTEGAESAPAGVPGLSDPLAGTFEKLGGGASDRLFRELVRSEAEAVVRVVAEGPNRWSAFRRSYAASSHKTPPPADTQVVSLAQRLLATRATQDTMAQALGAMEPPVLRRHRSAFLRHAERHHDVPLPQEARRAVERTAALRVRLIQAYVPLVFWVARRYPYGLHGLALRRAGVAGLIDAVDGFEPERGHRFQTYARWWILARISRIGGTTRPVHRSGHQAERLMRLGRAREEHWRANGRAPQWRDLMAAVPDDSSELSWLRAVVSARQFDHPLQVTHPEGGTLLDQLNDADPPDADRDEQLANLWRLYLQVEPDFKKHRATTLRARFGLDGEPPRTLSEIGNTLGLSRERIRQMEREALTLVAQRWRTRTP